MEHWTRNKISIIIFLEDINSHNYILYSEGTQTMIKVVTCAVVDAFKTTVQKLLSYQPTQKSCKL